ncbi:AMP-binding protein [Nonomuraea sp. NPDC050556]|uniref:AMP-binding protein n=1 Tax=Nonomuraea sp. NPDC050556 TaxID=3364369 RepID=UPI0037B759B1
MWTELVLRSVPEQGDRPAVTDVRTGEVLTFAAFERRVTHAAAGLRRRGLRSGDRVVVDLPPGAALPLAVHSVAWAGGVVVCPNSEGDATARMMITQGKWSHVEGGEIRQVFTMEPTEGASPFSDLLRGQPWEFGPISGPAVDCGGRVLSDNELASALRDMAAREVVREGDVVLAAITDRPRLVRLIDLSLMVGAKVIIAHDPTLIGCRVLAEEHRATVVVANRDLARRMGLHPGRRILEEAVLSSRHASCA